MRTGRTLRTGMGAVVAVGLCALSVLTAQAAPFGSADPASTGPTARYVVAFKSGADAGDQRDSRDDVVDAGGEVNRTYTRALRGFAADLPPEAVAELRSDPDVSAVLPDMPVGIDAVQPSAPWNLDRIDQRSPAPNTTFAYDGDGTGITVYVIDTGIRADHVEFGGRVTGGFTAIGDSNGTDDCNGHGTHVAGIVGSATYGVAKGVTLVPVRVLGCNGQGDGSGVLAGMDWVINNHVPGRSVINMSLGGEANSFLDQAVNNAIAAGIPVVVAAGNEGMDACGVSPARVPNAITVGAVDSTDARWSQSNFGSCLDLFAPGVGIRSSYSTSSSATALLTGTSMAAPHAAGTVATLLQGAPGATPAALRATLGSVFTTGGLSNVGAGSPNAMLYAPPRLRLAGVGSVTTADLFSALSADPTALAQTGQPQVDAQAVTGSATVAVQDLATFPTCSITRPTSQGASRGALLSSLAAVDGCVQFAEAESLDLSPASPRLAYVPFGRENVTFAISNTSNLPNSRTLTQLQYIFRCQSNPSFRPMLPPVGSGLREFWVSLMYPGGTLPAPAPSCLENGVDEFGTPVIANGGGQVNDFEIVPISASRWAAQVVGIGLDLNAYTRIGRVDGNNPFGTSFPLQRDLYTVIPASAVSGTSGNEIRLRNAFVGPTSLLCSSISTPVAVRHGFRPHPSCGSTALQTP